MAISFVKDAVANSNGATTTLAVTIAPAAGNTLVVQSGVAGVQTITGIVDNTGLNTYTVRAGVTNTVRAEVWTATNISIGVTTVTITYSAASNGNAAIVSEYFGVGFIGTNGTNTGAVSTPETISLTTTPPTSFVVSALVNNLGSTEAVTANTGTLRDHTASGAGVNTVQTAAVDNTAAFPVSVTTSANLGAGVNWAAAAVELQPPNFQGITVLQVNSGSQALAASVNVFTSVAQSFLTVDSENVAKITYRVPGTFSNLYARLTANASTSPNSVRFRKNLANGNQVLSIGAGLTGDFTLYNLVDTIVSGDVVAYQYIQAAGGAGGTWTILASLFSATDGTTTELFHAENNLNLNAVTRFYAIDGLLSTQTTEASSQFTVRTAGTFKDLQINVTTNGRATTTTFNFRKNTANGNQVVSVSGGATGFFEDQVHTDTVVSGDLINYAIVYGAEATTISPGINVTFSTTNNSFHFARGGSLSRSANTTTYFAPSGSLALTADGNVTESTFQTLAQLPLTLSSLGIRLASNTVTAASTLKLRKNAANGNQSVSITASTTGYFEDAVNTDVLAGTEEIDYQLAIGATGTNMNPVVMEMLASAPATPTNSPSSPNTIRLLPITGVGT
jgi:hypothetical protein